MMGLQSLALLRVIEQASRAWVVSWEERVYDANPSELRVRKVPGAMR